MATRTTQFDESTPTISGESAPSGFDLRAIGRVLTGLFLAALLITAGGIAGLGFYNSAHSTTVYEGVTVGGVDVGGMTRAEARSSINNHFETYMENLLLLQSSDGANQFAVDPKAAGVTIDLDATVDAAFGYGRSGSWWTRSSDWANAFLDGVETSAVMAIDEDRLNATLATISPSFTREPENAYLLMSDGEEPQIVPELNGVAFDVDRSTAAITSHFSLASPGPVILVTSNIPAEITVDDLAPGLITASKAVSAPLAVSGFDQLWEISEGDLRQIVSIAKGGQLRVVDDAAVTAFVQSIADQINQTAVDATLTVDQNGQLAMVESQQGIQVDVPATTSQVIQAIEAGTHDVALQYAAVPAQISDDAASQAVASGETMLSRGIEVRWEGGSTTFDRSILLEALTFRVNEENDPPFTFGFDRGILSAYLADIADQVNEPASDALLRVVDGNITVISPSATGHTVDYEATLDEIVTAALHGNGTATVSTTSVQPLVTEKMAADIKLDDILAEASTFYGDSSEPRRHNIQNAVGLIDGWLVAPGEEFSYANTLGPVTEEAGFITGFGIVDDPAGTGFTTAPVIGGGICQVSTTIFQSAWWSGLPIVERYSHPYWIQTYGEPPRGMKGLDAMVNIEESGSLDLRFTNTTGNWIAVQVVTDGAVLTARILGTDPGWTISVDDPIITNVVAPNRTVNYVESPEMEPGKELQVEYANEGFTAEVNRAVLDADGALIFEDSVVSNYAPSQNTILRGDGSTETPSTAEPAASPGATPTA